MLPLGQVWKSHTCSMMDDSRTRNWNMPSSAITCAHDLAFTFSMMVSVSFRPVVSVSFCPCVCVPSQPGVQLVAVKEPLQLQSLQAPKDSA